jgi:DNA polymerase III epsilon subunit-like protein
MTGPWHLVSVSDGGGGPRQEDTAGLLFSRHVDPGMSIPAKITQLTGITDEILNAHGAQPFALVWEEFIQWVRGVRNDKPVVLLAHNGAFLACGDGVSTHQHTV